MGLEFAKELLQKKHHGSLRFQLKCKATGVMRLLSILYVPHGMFRALLYSPRLEN